MQKGCHRRLFLAQGSQGRHGGDNSTKPRAIAMREPGDMDTTHLAGRWQQLGRSLLKSQYLVLRLPLQRRMSRRSAYS